MSLVRLDVDEAWGDAQPLLESALVGSDSTTDEIYNACKDGRAFLLGDGDGFAVLTQKPLKEGFAVLIWAAASKGQDCIATHYRQMQEIAKGTGARGIAFITARQAFSRIMPPEWKVKQVTWYMEF